MKRVVVAIYIDPDFFPPTINAILNIAERADEVVVISRNNSTGDYPYPPNVRLKKIGRQRTVRDMEKQSAWLKLFYFLRFTFALQKYGRHKKTELLLLYDPFALFSFFLVKHIRRKKKVWYHNHDMPDKGMLKKYSIGGLASRYEERAMQYVDYFSLPSRERLRFYPKRRATLPVFILPNYPSLKVYKDYHERSVSEKIRIIYQGFIGRGHSIETFIELLKENINGFELHLILKGSVTPGYKISLDRLAEQYQVNERLTWEKIGPYSELPALTASCHIGIGINTNTDMVSQAQGTASNKIYEYAASGLSVMLYNSEQFTHYLKKYDWAFFTAGSAQSIKENIEVMTRNLPALGRSARADFKKSLNHELYFIPVLDRVCRDLNSPDSIRRNIY